ncbi:hypothetical protein TNCV_4485931 [Trichonephila clavipes]|nr:hypothetical protein TNCV_4485931 [Trichonephila clavipes]
MCTRELVVLVQNSRSVALDIWPLLLQSFSKAFRSQDLNIVLLYYRLALKYPFNHNDVITIEQNDDYDRFLMQQIEQNIHHLQQPSDLPKVIYAIQSFEYIKCHIF